MNKKIKKIKKELGKNPATREEKIIKLLKKKKEVTATDVIAEFCDTTTGQWYLLLTRMTEAKKLKRKKVEGTYHYKLA